MKRTMLAQARMYSNGGCGESPTVHFQVNGPQGNRGYGFATTVETDYAVAGLVNQTPTTAKSLAGTGKDYGVFAVTAQRRDGGLAVRFAGLGNASLFVDAPELAEYILANGW